VLAPRPPPANLLPGCLLGKRQRSVLLGVSTNPAKIRQPPGNPAPSPAQAGLPGALLSGCGQRRLPVTPPGTTAEGRGKLPTHGASRALPHVPEEPGQPAVASGAVNPCEHSYLSPGAAGPSSLQSKTNISQDSVPQALRPPPQTRSGKRFPSAVEAILQQEQGSHTAYPGRPCGLFHSVKVTKQHQPLPALSPRKRLQCSSSHPCTETKPAHFAQPPLCQGHWCHL